MVSVGADGSNHQVNADNTVSRKEKDDLKCCMCISLPCGATTLFVLEILYLIYFILLCISLVVARMFATGELKVPKGTMECTHLYKTYKTKDANGDFVQTYKTAEECRNSAAYKQSTTITDKA